jgi:hypothetical protein
VVCREFAEKALEITQKPMDYLCEEFAWGPMPYDLAALASYNLKDKKAAIKYGSKAVQLSPDEERLQRNLEFYKAN